MPTKVQQPEAQKIPKLRFPGFSDEWEEKGLGEISRRIGDGIHTTPVYDNDGKYYFVNGNNLTNSKVNISRDTKRVKAGEFKKHDRNLDLNTLLLSINGTIGNVAYYQNEKIVLGKSACYIKLNKNINKHFIYSILLTSKIQNIFNAELTGSTIKNLSLKSVASTKIYIPKDEEQQKIAEFLGLTDEWINNLRDQKESFESYKKGMMQKIFDQEIRFKDDRGKEFPRWEEKKLGEIGKAYNGLTGKAGEDFGHGEAFITYKQIFDSSEIDIQKFSLVNVLANERQSKAQFGDIFFTTTSETPGEVGFSSVLLDKNVAPYLNSFSFGLRLNSLKEHDPYFAKFFFRSFVFRKEVVKLAQGSTRYNISKIEFMKMKFPFPSVLEQQKIAGFLTSIDKVIESKQQQITQAERWKKGLMQGVFV
jgi:type I restriction enzyme S subunit